MKKVIAGCVMFSTSLIPVNANAGMPTVDVGAIAQAVLMVAEAKKQYEELTKMYEQRFDIAESAEAELKRRLEGEWDAYVYDSSIEYLDGMDGISQSEIDAHLNGIDIGESDSELKRQYEEKALQIARLDKAIQRTEKEFDNINELKGVLASAKTPREREAAQNAMQLAAMAAQNAQRALDNEMARQQRVNQIAEEAALNQYMDNDMAMPSVGGYFQIEKAKHAQ